MEDLCLERLRCDLVEGQGGVLGRFTRRRSSCHLELGVGGAVSIEETPLEELPLVLVVVVVPPLLQVEDVVFFSGRGAWSNRIMLASIMV
eukprot:CAMPEP_0206523450 /NCGR_PEP_ID=MMETSP0324_2-20121206/67626_1 /ASSEMBLY_ACC=CAM_ASM_000836 /TAXON_ID=2866 /ORGANISM="Crypthecodinium cohnii, Strain Seligo" /LENGTH=89 /DNA_ID=CAMNT_0054017889 /DNA_START=410 /DNA_END=679 /DNA_ORIENTATION=+